jgi:hypothetical protein
MCETEFVQTIGGPSGGPVAISGTFLSAVNLAYADWAKRVSRGHFRLSDQDIGIVKTKSGFVQVTILSNRFKGSLKAAQYGSDVVYLVDVNKQRILCRSVGDFL